MSVQKDNLLIECVGHSTIRIKSSENKVIYIDPWSKCFDGEPRDGDLIFITHDDSDHYDPNAISSVANQSATVAAYEAITTDELEMVVTELPYNGTAVVAGIDVQTVPGYNDPTGEHVDENNNPYHADGEVIGLQIIIDDTSIFYPSDTDILPHHNQISAEVLLPPIGGTYTMNRHEAAELARNIKPELIIPVHYDTFEAIETDVDAFVDEVTNNEISVKVD